MPSDTIAAEHAEWMRARDAAVLGPTGTAQLRTHTWLDGTPQPVPGIDGLWRAAGSHAEGLDEAAGLSLGPGETAPLGKLTLAGYVRDGHVALRVFDPARAAHLGIHGVVRAPYDPDLRTTARFDPTPRGPLPTVSVDGHRAESLFDGALELTLAGTPLTLLVRREPDSLFATFSDAGTGDGYEFRMLRTALPGDDGQTVVDLNHAYLPPSRFSPGFTCVRPRPENTWPLAIVAGEIAVLITGGE